MPTDKPTQPSPPAEAPDLGRRKPVDPGATFPVVGEEALGCGLEVLTQLLRVSPAEGDELCDQSKAIGAARRGTVRTRGSGFRSF